MRVYLTDAMTEFPRRFPAESPEMALDLGHAPASVGRDREADFCLDECHVSRQHCKLELVDDAVVVRDLDSTNGTYVNGLKVSEAVLKPGDKLTVGAITFLVEYRARQSTLFDSAAQT